MLLLVVLINSKIAICQKNSIVYKSNYSCDIKYVSQNKDTLKKYDLDVKMKINYTVYSSKKFAYLIAKVEEINLPISISQSEDTIFIDYEKSIAYWFSEKKSKLMIAHFNEAIEDSSQKINGYKSTLNKIRCLNGNNVIAWTTKVLPWFVNPGLFTNELQSGVTKIQTEKSELVLLNARVTKFNFKKIIKKVSNFKKTTEKIDMLETL